MYFYVRAPTETKVIRNRMRVKNSVNSTLKSAKIPTLIVDEFINQLVYITQRDIKRDLTKFYREFYSVIILVRKPSFIGLMLLTDHKFICLDTD